MTRAITKAAAAALMQGYNFKQANTRVDGEARKMYLHGNEIAKIENGVLYINLCGWVTLTTCERLNGLPGVWLNRCKGKVYQHGVEIDSKSWIKID